MLRLLFNNDESVKKQCVLPEDRKLMQPKRVGVGELVKRKSHNKCASSWLIYSVQLQYVLRRQLVKKFSEVMEPKGPLPCPKQLGICPYTEQHDTVHAPSTHLFKIYFIL